MSKYLSQFYCGNNKELCNFNKPMDYSKLINRQFDHNIHNMVYQCDEDKLDKGYCCNSTDEELKKPMDEEYMEHINKEYGHDIFKKDHNDNFVPGQVPLVKVNTKDGEMKSLDICTCGGKSLEYANCIAENCKDFRTPTRYEFCKLGSEYNKKYCVNEQGENNFRCKMEPVYKGSDKMYSHNLRVGELMPDCFLNMCNKDPKISKLDDVIPSQTFDPNIHFNLKGNTLRTYGMLKNKNDETEINNNENNNVNNNGNNDVNNNVNNNGNNNKITNKSVAKGKSLMDYFNY